ncbi:MAG: hypothetical protein ACI92X_001995 [Dokdonia sp.]
MFIELATGPSNNFELQNPEMKIQINYTVQIDIIALDTLLLIVYYCLESLRDGRLGFQ